MRGYWSELISETLRHLQGDEVLTAYYAGEHTAFCRFNQGKIRQPGEVRQGQINLRLISKKRQTNYELDLCGVKADDLKRLKDALQHLRSVLPLLPEDPYLLYNDKVRSNAQEGRNSLPAPQQCVEDILGTAAGHDVVGIFASGPTYRGFMNSFGQENWFEQHSFNFDFSVYHSGDKAVKARLAGSAWSRSALQKLLTASAAELKILTKPVKNLKPGKYRVYLAPQAVMELLGLLSWNGFGIRSQMTKASPLVKLADGDKELSPLLSLAEETTGAVAPAFNEEGYPKPQSQPLIKGGKLAGQLISPRSAREFETTPNGANAAETCIALNMGSGTLDESEILKELGTGILISNLWYLNYSDVEQGRITGMTRFATFWVEGGQVIAPCPVMRFDESLYRMFGPNLINLTNNPQYIINSDTYFMRSLGSYRLPGALVSDFTLTL